MPRWSNMIEDLVSRVTEIGSAMLDSNQTSEQTLTQKCEALLSNLGEATGLARSKEILDDTKRKSWLSFKQFAKSLALIKSP